MNVVLFTIIVVITLNLIRICCALSLLSMGRHWAIRTLNFKEVSYEIVNLHNHCSDKLEPNSKEHSEYAVLCCEVQQIFFFWLSMGRRWAIRTLNFKQVSYESGTLHNHCSDNLEPNSKDISEYAVLCSLLRGSTDFFFWLSMGRRWAIRTLNFKQVSYESGTLHNHCSDNHEPNSKDNSVPCCEVQQIFFSSGFPWEDVEL